jgi:hypothetical protein
VRRTRRAPAAGAVASTASAWSAVRAHLKPDGANLAIETTDRKVRVPRTAIASDQRELGSGDVPFEVSNRPVDLLE